MRLNFLPIVLISGVLLSGCDSATVDELTKKVDQLQKENAELKDKLQAVQQKVAQIDAIRKGYEEARVKFQQQLAGLTAVLGAGAASPLPPFEDLKNSEWVGKLMPGAAVDLGKLKELKEVESGLLKDLLGDQKKKD